MFTLKNSTRGFTLIELLVVITIIGILATGGTAVFTTQIQKARDSTRQSEIAQYFSATEQYLSDNSAYPAASVSFTGVVKKYMSKLGEDPKAASSVCKGSTGAALACNYYYNVGNNSDGLTDMAFKLSTTFENTGNITNIAADAKDGGNSGSYFEEYGGGGSGATLAIGTMAIRK